MLVLLLGGFLFFYRLADRDLWSSHEGRAAQDAQTILDDGRWGLLRLYDRQVEAQKPPLYYWLVALAAQLRGGPVDAWEVRCPAALSGLGTVLLLFLFGYGRGRPLAGLIAGLTLTTMVHFTWLARIGRIDMPLTFVVTIILGCFYQAFRGNGRTSRWLMPAYLAAAAAMLLKGPIGVVLPAAVASGFMLLERAAACLPASGERARNGTGLWRSLGWGVPLVLALTLPWFWWVATQTQGSWYRSFFLYHNFERAFGGAGGLRAHPWWFYLPRLAIDLLPWSLLLPFAGVFLLKGSRWRQDPEARLGFVWLVVMVAVLSCARFKRADYLLPAYPGAALLLGCAAERWWRERKEVRHGVRMPKLGACLVSVAAFGIVTGSAGGWWIYVDRVLPLQEPAREQRRLAAEIRRRAPAPEVVIFFRVESHALAFHVGRPINTILEWENLNVWVGRPGPRYLVMPPDCVRDWPRHITTGRLEEVLRNEALAGGRHEHPLVLMRATSFAE